MRITDIREVAAGCKMLTLENTQDGPLPAAEPGAHVGLWLPCGMERQYSLLRADPQPTAYEIAVKLDPRGRGGSACVHDQLKASDLIAVTPPRNNFHLAETSGESLFLAGGIGITPLICMIRQLRKVHRPWSLHFASRTRADAPFLSELVEQQSVNLHFDDEHDGAPMPVSDILRRSFAEHVYCCGPTPMLAAFEDAAKTLRLPPERMHIEYFTQKQEAATDGGFIVELSQSGLTLAVPPGSTILETVRKAGVTVASSCEEGICGSCETVVLAGIPDHRDAFLSEREQAESRTMMICCSGSKSPRLVLNL